MRRRNLGVESKVVFNPGTELSIAFGFHDENLRAIESAFGVKVVARGNEVTVKGATESVKTALNVLAMMRDSEVAITAETIKSIASGRMEKPVKPAGDVVDLAVRTPKQLVVPRGERQAAYIKAIRSCDAVFGVGPAGTGKTYLAVACALSAFSNRAVERIILVRPVVEAGERLGFLPGDIQEKVDPYMRPLYDAMHDMLDVQTLTRLVAQEIIEIAPLAYMRGRTLNKAFIILDEAQNTTVEQMKMFLTRLGASSSAVVTGDVTQVDLPKETQSGLVHAVHILRGIEGIKIVDFLPADVVRHEIVQRILDAYEGDSGGIRRARKGK